MAYSLKELRDTTDRHCDNPEAHIPCPDCDNARLLCSLCDGMQSVSKARALAVLPIIVEHQRELMERTARLLRKYGQHISSCEKHPDQIANRMSLQYDCDGNPKSPQCDCGLEKAITKGR